MTQRLNVLRNRACGTTFLWAILTVLQSQLSTVKSQSQPQQYTVREECANGTFVGYVQIPEAYRDRPYALRVIKYPPDLFTINATAIYTKTRVDRESLCDPKTPRCVVYISVNAEPSSLIIPKLAVLVEDVNDNAPHFPSFANDEYNVAISELIQPNASNSVFELPLASDDDQRYGVQNYRLLDRTEEFSLLVQRRSDDPVGEVERVALVLRRQLDREKKDFYQLRLVAIDSSDSQNRVNTATLTVRVSVIDANDHRPVFTESFYRVSIPEDYSLQTTFLSVFARDLDLDRNGEPLYEIAPSASRAIREKFTIERDSGDLKLRDLVDYETQRSYIIPVVACDQAQPPLCGNATVEVSLIDVNDEAPSIAVAYENDAHSVSEAARAGSLVAFLTVTDRDSGPSGIGGVKCSSDNPKFALVQRAGQSIDNFTIEFNVVITSVQLDREKLMQDARISEDAGSAEDRMVQEVVLIRCEDSGDQQRQADSVTLVFNVADSNDNAPYFVANGRRISYLEANVAENSPPRTLVAHIEAYDDDAGENARIVYSLVGGNQDSFAIDPSSGELSTRRALDREATDSYAVNVSACDRGSPHLCSTLFVTVSVDDANDCVPYMASVHDFTVHESPNINNPVGKLQAFDRDATTSNHKIGFQEQFGMLPDENLPAGYGVADMFYVEHDGEIRLKKPLDREKRDFYRFIVRVFDNGSPQRSLLVNVTVRVLNANDNAPQLAFYANNVFPIINDSIAISYLEPVGARICEVRASDADSENGERIMFALRDGNMDDVFHIDAYTGVISLNRQLTISSVGSSRVLMVEASDGVLRGTSSLVIYVDDAPSRVLLSRNKVHRDDSTDASAESFLSTKSVLAICICVMIIVLMIGLFTFIYVKYFYETIEKRHNRNPHSKKQPPSPTSQSSRRRRPNSRARSHRHGPATVEDKQRALIAALRDPESNVTESDQQRISVSIMSENEIDPNGTSEFGAQRRVSENPLNQISHSGMDAMGDYAALDQLSDSHAPYRQYATFAHASRFGSHQTSFGTMGAVGNLVHDQPALRSMMGSRQQQAIGCSDCGMHSMDDAVWRQREFGTCPHQLALIDQLQLSRTVSNNQDASTVNSAHDESGSDNNAVLIDRSRQEETESGSDKLQRSVHRSEKGGQSDDRSSKRRGRPSLTKRASNESRAFSTAGESDTRLAVRNTPNAMTGKLDAYMRPPSVHPAEYAQYTQGDCTGNLMLLAGLCPHPQVAGSFYPPPHVNAPMNALATIGGLKNSESFLSSHALMESTGGRSPRDLAMCAMTPNDHERLLLAHGSYEANWRDNQNEADRERFNEDINANKLGSISAHHIPSSAIRLVPSRAEPETSYV